MEKLKEILNNRSCLKLICGAGNENIKEIEKLVYVYASAGFNLVDVSAKTDVIRAARRGIERSGTDALLCVSVGLQDDIHLSKAFINKQKCINCGQCLNICPQTAIYTEDEIYIVDEKKCIGCMRCKSHCSNDAILVEKKTKAPYAMLLPLLSEKIDCVEYHCSSEKVNDIIDNWHKIQSVYNGMLSICLDRSKLGNDKLYSLISDMIKDSPDYTFVLQTDGRPMSGSGNDYKSTLQAVAFAELINSYNMPVYIILSGGTNAKSSMLARECDVKINGVAIGSYARKIVKEFIDADNFFEDDISCNKAISAAKNLANEILNYT